MLRLISSFLLFLFLWVEAQETRLVWAVYESPNGKIQTSNLDGSDLKTIAEGRNAPSGVAVDNSVIPPKLYYAERGANKIVKVNFDGSNEDSVITNCVGIYDIELDPVHRKIYWVTSTYNTDSLFRADMDGLNSDIEVLYGSGSTGYDYLGLALDTVNEYVFWLRRNNGCADKIYRMNYDKSDFRVVVEHPQNALIGPWDIDVYNNKIYWVDCGLSEDAIFSADLDGSNIDTVVTEANCQFFTIEPSSEKIYFAQDGKIECAGLDNSGYVNVLTDLATSIYGIGIAYNVPVSAISYHYPVAKSFILHNNYPNPFNPSTTISYTLIEPGFVSLKIYDIEGSEVAGLVNEYQVKNTYSLEFNADGLASGVYFYKLQVDNTFSETRKMILMQ